MKGSDKVSEAIQIYITIIVHVINPFLYPNSQVILPGVFISYHCDAYALCACICMFVCVILCICKCVRLCMCMCACTYLSAYLYVCVCLCVGAYSKIHT